MCGICGVLETGRRAPDKGTLGKMIGTLRHRGPDGSGIYVDDRAGLAHARLSIIDLAGGRQPLSNEDGSVWITYNGEIFNYLELREALEAAGHRFSTKTDTEVIVHLYEEKGEDFLSYLNGQFAFALWDKNKKQMILARDRIGIRPLFFAEEGGALLFGSEVKAILADGRLRAGLDPAGLDQFFTFWATIPPQTIFKGIRELPPAHYLTVRRGRMEMKRYWELSFPGSPARALPADEKRYAERLLDLLLDATRLRLRADVPVAAYLSGGIDSSFITSLVKKYFNPSLKSFSVRFADSDYDEGAHQDMVARYLGTEHRVITCSSSDIGRVMPDVVWHAEKPLIRTAPAPLYLLSKLVRENGIKVVLTGEGADEILGGYDLFREAKIRRFWAKYPDSKLRPLLLRALYRYVPNWNRAPAYLEAFYRGSLGDTGNPFYSHLPRWRTTMGAKNYFSAGMREELKGVDAPSSLARTLPEGFSRWDALSRAQYLEIVTLLSGNLLSSQGDRVMMANSVEGRLPFLDYRLVEFCAALPPNLKLKTLKEKYLLKEIARPFVPPEIVRRAKQAYRAPDSISFFGSAPPEYVSYLLSDENIRATGYFDPAAVRSLAGKCRASESPLIGTRDNIAITGIITTLLLHDQFVENFEKMTSGRGLAHENITRGAKNEDLLTVRSA